VTLKTGRGYIFNRDNFTTESTFKFEHDGWGVTYFKQNIIISDGKSHLYWYSDDNKNLSLVKQVTVNGVALNGINEMVVIGDLIYANIWPTDCIAVIEPLESKVIGWLDISNLYPWNDRSHWSHVSNGLAFEKNKQELWVTGKNWDKIFKLKLAKINVSK